MSERLTDPPRSFPVHKIVLSCHVFTGHFGARSSGLWDNRYLAITFPDEYLT